ncbi:MAG: glycosyltransferase [Prevotella sp.]|nr:glycosyltransferase [Prevotella sp.]
MEKKCKLSIIIPMYNAEKYITRLLVSCYQQDLEESLYEVIVIDDGSIDKSKDIVSEWQHTHNNLVYRYQDNAGQGLARNYGLSIAQGEYVWFVDSDDEIEQNCLGKLVEEAFSKELDMLFCNEVLKFEDGRPDQKGDYEGMLYDKICSGEECFRRGFYAYAVSQCLIKQKLLKEQQLLFKPKRIGEDAELCYHLMAYAERVVFIHDTFYIYHVNGNSVTQANMDKPEVVRGKLLDTISVSESLIALAKKIKKAKPFIASCLKSRAEQIVFGALYSLWKQRKFLAGELPEMIAILKKERVLPFKVSPLHWKRFLISTFIINRM